VLIDSGYCPDAAYEFSRLYGEPYRASKGIGEGRFHHGSQGVNRQVGNYWYATPQPAGIWLYQPDADYWKRQVHERFLADPVDENGRARPGSLTLFVPIGKRDHHSFAQHIMAEEWVTEFIAGKGERSRFQKHSNNNHYLDATAMMLCGAEMEGYGIFTPEPDTRRRAAVISSGRSNSARW
jgi:hypothetical protein